DISENEPENQSDDDDDDMSGFIVDDNEDLENVAISDGDDNLELESEDGEYEEKYVEMDDDEYQLKNFVVEKKLLSSEKVISSVWKREGELLHQYKRQETDCHGDDLDDGDEELDIFERTDETADYRTKGRNQYRPITVQWLHDKEREENTAIQVISWDPPISVEVTDELLP
ncbi:uncharacterized protein LOC102805070, partial [Saccoglossus kowalevskii]|uniref:Nuclear polyadenylated RNA-binding protein 3-like n=1 Tax=Saccoglossus kowalevskii TaxID=10224 RepID=A0ABM0LYL6_SACKO